MLGYISTENQIPRRICYW